MPGETLLLRQRQNKRPETSTVSGRFRCVGRAQIWEATAKASRMAFWMVAGLVQSPMA